MPTPMAEWFKTLAGERVMSMQHREAVAVSTATTVTGAAFASLSSYRPWTHETVNELLASHPLAISTSLTITVIPGPGIFGRAIALHMAWGNVNEPAPTTITAMSRMQGYRMHTYGGAADPGESDRKFRAPFNEARSDVLKAQYYPIGGKIVFYYFFTEANFGTVQVNGDRFVLQIEHDFDVYGRN